MFDNDTDLVEPFSKLIPKNIWIHPWVFNGNVINEDVIFLSRTLEQLLVSDYCELDEKIRCRALFILLIRFKNESYDKLKVLTHQTLNLTDNHLFQFSAALGYLHILKLIQNDCSSLEFQQMLESDYYKTSYGALSWVVENQHIEVYKWLVSQQKLPLSELLGFEDQFGLFLTAIENNDVKSYEWFNQQLGDFHSQLIETRLRDLVNIAVERGSLDIMIMFHKNFEKECDNLLRDDDFHLFRTAVLSKQVGVVKWFMLAYPLEVESMIASNHYQAFFDAVINNLRPLTKLFIAQPGCYHFVSDYDQLHGTDFVIESISSRALERIGLYSGELRRNHSPDQHKSLSL